MTVNVHTTKELSEEAVNLYLGCKKPFSFSAWMSSAGTSLAGMFSSAGNKTKVSVSSMPTDPLQKLYYELIKLHAADDIEQGDSAKALVLNNGQALYLKDERTKQQKPYTALDQLLYRLAYTGLSYLIAMQYVTNGQEDLSDLAKTFSAKILAIKNNLQNLPLEQVISLAGQTLEEFVMDNILLKMAPEFSDNAQKWNKSKIQKTLSSIFEQLNNSMQVITLPLAMATIKSDSSKIISTNNTLHALSPNDDTTNEITKELSGNTLSTLSKRLIKKRASAFPISPFWRKKASDQDKKPKASTVPKRDKQTNWRGIIDGVRLTVEVGGGLAIGGLLLAALL